MGTLIPWNNGVNGNSYGAKWYVECIETFFAASIFRLMAWSARANTSLSRKCQYTQTDYSWSWKPQQKRFRNKMQKQLFLLLKIITGHYHTNKKIALDSTQIETCPTTAPDAKFHCSQLNAVIPIKSNKIVCNLPPSDSPLHYLPIYAQFSRAVFSLQVCHVEFFMRFTYLPRELIVPLFHRASIHTVLKHILRPGRERVVCSIRVLQVFHILHRSLIHHSLITIILQNKYNTAISRLQLDGHHSGRHCCEGRTTLT
jgi:hypothetical protein